MVELGSHIEVVNGRFTAIDSIEDHKRVYFEVCKVEVDVDGVETDEEINKGILLLSRDVGEEGSSDFLTRGERFVDSNLENESLGIDVTNVNTTLVREEDAITLALRVDADIVFGVGRVRKERFDDEVVQGTSDGLNLVSRASESQFTK